MSTLRLNIALILISRICLFFAACLDVLVKAGYNKRVKLRMGRRGLRNDRSAAPDVPMWRRYDIAPPSLSIGRPLPDYSQNCPSLSSSAPNSTYLVRVENPRHNHYSVDKNNQPYSFREHSSDPIVPNYLVRSGPVPTIISPVRKHLFPIRLGPVRSCAFARW